MDTSFNLFDLIFIGFALIFVVTAFFRGFVKEIFSLFNWLVAFLLSYVLTPYITKFFDNYSNPMIIDVVTRSILFIVILIILSILTSNLCSDMQAKISNAFDKSLGVFYGMIKTLLIFGIIHSLMINTFSYVAKKQITTSSPQYPTWLKNARSYDLIKFSSGIVDPSIKALFSEVIGKNFDKLLPKKSDLDEKIDKVIDEKDNVEEEIKDISGNVKDSGYDKKDIEKMNRLIEIIDK